ncbi:hypothetical protein BD626DRAFT_248832 [Schizophyllum amplum]|uniref:Uncharacterized protein n=1 Tax=Schizophyllum amplum TaxID=97359 RepID=A0A550CHC3_9AGAR|nr:hypothetical protein BD626DRAFT_248832 [Auriculariopsis ampla]
MNFTRLYRRLRSLIGTLTSSFAASLFSTPLGGTPYLNARARSKQSRAPKTTPKKNYQLNSGRGPRRIANPVRRLVRLSSATFCGFVLNPLATIWWAMSDSGRDDWRALWNKLKMLYPNAISRQSTHADEQHVPATLGAPNPYSLQRPAYDALHRSESSHQSPIYIRQDLDWAPAVAAPPSACLAPNKATRKRRHKLLEGEVTSLSDKQTARPCLPQAYPSKVARTRRDPRPRASERHDTDANGFTSASTVNKPSNSSHSGWIPAAPLPANGTLSHFVAPFASSSRQPSTLSPQLSAASPDGVLASLHMPKPTYPPSRFSFILNETSGLLDCSSQQSTSSAGYTTCHEIPTVCSQSATSAYSQDSLAAYQPGTPTASSRGHPFATNYGHDASAFSSQSWGSAPPPSPYKDAPFSTHSLQAYPDALPPASHMQSGLSLFYPGDLGFRSEASVVHSQTDFSDTATSLGHNFVASQSPVWLNDSPAHHDSSAAVLDDLFLIGASIGTSWNGLTTYRTNGGASTADDRSGQPVEWPATEGVGPYHE